MTGVTKISACVDCGTSIIGGYLRCPACNERHSRKESPVHVFSSWVVFVEILVMAVCGLVLALRGCP